MTPQVINLRVCAAHRAYISRDALPRPGTRIVDAGRKPEHDSAFPASVIVYRHVLGRPLHTARDVEIGNASVHRFDCDATAWNLLHDAAPTGRGITPDVE